MSQAYRQSTLKRSGAKNLKPRCHGPFRMTRRVGEVAYELELPVDSNIHNLFHESLLEKALGHNVVPSTNLPVLDDDGKLVLVFDAILDTRDCMLSRTIREYLACWKNLPIEDVTWESEDILQHLESRFVEEKQFQGDKTVMSPF